MRPLVECVANFSEGQRPEVVESIVTAIAEAGGVHILDYSADPDHNRCVVTFIGLPIEIEKAAYAGIKTASELIDLNQQSGVHPRFGAADVIPFVPIRDITLEECAQLAHQLGERVATTLNIPIYFYEAAALRAEYADLANIRRPGFQYEQLREQIGADPYWMPDLGPARLGPAGACIIGARYPLVAYNVFLNTDDLEIAREISRAIRHSSGGLRYVKSAAFMVRGRAQISLNFTDYRQTTVFRVVEMIRREAARYGLTVTSSELIGLIPEDALLDTAAWHLQIMNFDKSMILEQRIAEAEAQPQPLSEEEPPIPEDATSHITLPTPDEARRPEQFVALVAEATSTPGAGGVLALAGALAAALAEMTAGLTVNKKGYEDVREQVKAIRAGAYHLRDQLLDAIAQDAEAIHALIDTIRQGRDDPSERAENAIQYATLATADVPLSIARKAHHVLQLLEQIVEIGNHNAVIDAAVGAQMALTTVEGAALTVRANLLAVTNQEIVGRYRDDMDYIVAESRQILERVMQVTAQRVGLDEVQK